MDKFQETLNRIDKELVEMYEQCQFVRHFYNTGNKEQAYASAFDLAKISEKITLLTRALPCYTGNPRANFDMEKCIQ